MGDHLPTPVMAATAIEIYSESVAITKVNYENKACGLSLNGYSQEEIMNLKEIDILRIRNCMEIFLLRIT